MSAKPLEVKKVTPVVPVVEPVKSHAQKEKELIAQKVMSDTLNSEKAKRDLQIRTVDQLETQIKTLQGEIAALVADYNIKVRINDNLGASITQAHYDLANYKAKFDEQNAKLVASYDKRAKEVEEADKTLQALLKDNRLKEQELARDRGAFNSERESNRQQVKAMQNALDQNNAEWKKREADLLLREDALKNEKEAFEKYQESLAPEIARITSIKNENLALIQRVEQEKRNADNMRLAAAAERAQAEESIAMAKEKTNQERMRITNEEARLRKWEQDIKDMELEVKVQSEEAQKMMKRYQLTEKMDK